MRQPDRVGDEGVTTAEWDAIEKARAEECEACAKIADIAADVAAGYLAKSTSQAQRIMLEHGQDIAKRIAQYIRARGHK